MSQNQQGYPDLDQETTDNLNIEENDNLARQNQVSSKETVNSMFNEKELEGKHLPWYKKFAYKLDIFQFIPVPKTRPVSTTKSFIASLIFIILILSFCIYTFVEFLVNNSPRASQFFIPLGDQKFEAPQFAVGFFEGKETLEPFDLSSGEYFTIKLYQQYRKIDEEPDKQPLETAHGKDCDFEWLNSVKQFTTHLVCPDYNKIKPTKENDNKQVVVQGNAGFDEYMYPQVLVEWCDPDGEIKCKSQDEIRKLVAGGRIQLYLKNAVQKNYATNEVADYTFDFTMYYYFLVPGSYNRYAVDYQVQLINQLPDMFTSFSTKEIISFWIKDQIFYPSKNVYDKNRAFSVWLTLNPNIQRIDYAYDTIFVVGPMMGAFCSVMFTAFSFIFLTYNSAKFYKKNKQWDDISGTMNQLKYIDGQDQPKRQISFQVSETGQRVQQASNIELITSLADEQHKI